MWTLLNSTVYAAERGFARDRNGAEIWMVVVKGTFIIGEDGSTTLAHTQQEIHEGPQFFGDPTSSSLRYDSDLLPFRPFTDVVLLGHAYAPQDRPAARVEVMLRVGPISKRLTISGDRTWRRRAFGLAMSEPEPFERMPLVYERAFGGVDPGGESRAFEPRNPVGVGFAASPSSLVDRPAPNIEDPADLIRSADDHPVPAGFGPIPAHWAPRARRAGTHDERWRRERMPLVPDDFEDRYYQCAPDDQQVHGRLKGGEQVELHNLTPGGLLRFTLPQISLGFLTRLAGDPVHHRAEMHAVTIEPDLRRVQILWHTEVPCHHTLYSLDGTHVWEKRRVPLGMNNTPRRRLPLAPRDGGERGPR